MWAAHITGPGAVRPCGPCCPMTKDPAELLRGAAIEIARVPGLAERLRARHVPGPDGRCRGCPSPVHSAPRWPCRITSITTPPAEPP